ncbi:DEAD/DEAH box helicase [bacterium]|nr:DEAD/DEAH box helicase [bacterium]
MIQFSFDEKKGVGILSGDLFQDLREHFSVKNDAAFFVRRRYGRFLPQRTYAITPTGRFEPGLYFEIRKAITNKQYIGDVKTDDSLLKIITPSRCWQANPQYDSTIVPLALPLRDYQEEIVKKALNIGRGTIVLATAGGKTLTAASLLTKLFLLNGQKFKCLYIVPDLGLAEQTTSDFNSYNVPFTLCKWTGSTPLDTNNKVNVVVANLGILQSKHTDLSWIQDVDALIIDEVHKIRKGNEVNKIIKRIKTAVRYGFTGTMPENLLDQWNIIGKIGPIIYEKNSYELRVENFVSNVHVQILKLIYKEDPFKDLVISSMNLYREEQRFLIRNKFRNDIIGKISCKLNNNALILVDYIEHGELLYEATKLLCPNKKVYFIRGEVEITEREKIRSLMEKTNDVVVIAISKIFSTGINIKNLHYIIFACGGKAKIKIVQSIGRGLRLHKDKDKLIIIDVADDLKYSTAHMQKRIALYEKEKINYTVKKIQEV